MTAGPATRSAVRPLAARARAPGLASWTLSWLCFFAWSASASTDTPFRVQVIPSAGRTVAAELADVDGDGRQDLIQAVTLGMPPDERRVIRLYAQKPDGSIPEAPDATAVVPPNSAAYDVADVDGVPGAEILLLRRRGMGLISFARDEGGRYRARVGELQIPEDMTMGVTDDERGLDRLVMTTRALGPEPVLVVPGLGETFFLTPTGALVARVESGARSNYFVQPPGPMLSESDIQIFLDAPRISIGDVDGDGRADIVASRRHEILLFLRAEDGSFPRQPSRRIPLGRVSFEDHIRGTGAVRTAARDIDGDGLADLIVSQTRGGVMNANWDTTIHFNRGSGWDLASPDYAFTGRESIGADQLIDLDGDGMAELLRIGIPLSVLEMIEVFLTEALDANLAAYRLVRADTPPARPATPEPWFEVKFGIPLDFKTSRPAGFVPTVDYDWNGDGFRDYISSADGERLEIFLGDPEEGFPRRSARQRLSTEGQLRTGDLNGDGLTDAVIFNTRRNDEPVKLLTNLGVLPGTRPGMKAR